MAIKEARGSRSALWLSDRTAELGFRVSPTVIAKLDSGHRGSVLSVAELVVLAAALDTSPLVLLYPGPYNKTVEVLPGRALSELDAVQWFSARAWYAALAIIDKERSASESRSAWRSATDPVRSWAQLADLEAVRGALMSHAHFDQFTAQIASYDKQIEDLRRELGVDDA
jgi:hypothetical protein